jgi:hypothetical protein
MIDEVMEGGGGELKRPHFPDLSVLVFFFISPQSHIMASEEAELVGELKLPHLPDMLFLHNRLRCAHASGFHLEVRLVFHCNVR